MPDSFFLFSLRGKAVHVLELKLFMPQMDSEDLQPRYIKCCYVITLQACNLDLVGNYNNTIWSFPALVSSLPGTNFKLLSLDNFVQVFKSWLLFSNLLSLTIRSSIIRIKQIINLCLTIVPLPLPITWNILTEHVADKSGLILQHFNLILILTKAKLVMKVNLP